MRIAVLCDIHGNLPALEAVLSEIRGEGADRLVVGGDVVPGPLPGECLSALIACPIPIRFVHGNGEVDVLTVHDGGEPSRVPLAVRPVLRWVEERLGAEHLAAIRTWPRLDRVHMAGVGEVLFCHATPRDENEVFTRRTPEARLRPIFDVTGASLVVCGHTHMQFDRMVGRVRVVNAGSVGMPFGEPGACWAMLGPDGVTLRRTHYDLEPAQARIRAAGFPDPPGFDVRTPPSEEHMLEVLEAAAVRQRSTSQM